jgi:hypothetical protein
MPVSHVRPFRPKQSTWSVSLYNPWPKGFFNKQPDHNMAPDDGNGKAANDMPIGDHSGFLA